MNFLTPDDPDLKAEIAALKRGLKCRSFREDLDFVLSDLDLKVFNQKPGKWPVPVVFAEALITETCYERGALEPLAHIYKDHYWPVSGYIHEFVERARSSARHDLVQRVWEGVLDSTKRRFFEWLPDRKRLILSGTLQADSEDPECEAVLAAYDALIACLEHQGHLAASGRLRSERDAFVRGEFRKPLPAPSRTIGDEAAFWSMIAEARTASGSTAETRTRLLSLLESLDTASIRKFNSIYAKTMKRLHHWNAWALAYGCRGGCGEDAFLDFRSWLVLQGNPVLIDLAIASPERAADHVPPHPDMSGGTLNSTIEAACLARSGKMLPRIATDLERPRGKAWDEDRFEDVFPELAAFYSTSL